MTPPSILKQRMASVIFITEERGWWVKGRLRRDESVAVEMCFDNPRLDELPFSEDVPLVYLGLMDPARCRFEFQNGFVAVQPVDPQTNQDVMMILLHVANYRHQPVPFPRRLPDPEAPEVERPTPPRRRRPRFYRMPIQARK